VLFCTIDKTARRFPSKSALNRVIPFKQKSCQEAQFQNEKQTLEMNLVAEEIHAQAD
jgi:hypothetical protein